MQAKASLFSYCCEGSARYYALPQLATHYKYIFPPLSRPRSPLSFLIFGRWQRAILLETLLLGEITELKTVCIQIQIKLPSFEKKKNKMKYSRAWSGLPPRMPRMFRIALERTHLEKLQMQSKVLKWKQHFSLSPLPEFTVLMFSSPRQPKAAFRMLDERENNPLPHNNHPQFHSCSSRTIFLATIF